MIKAVIRFLSVATLIVAPFSKASSEESMLRQQSFQSKSIDEIVTELKSHFHSIEAENPELMKKIKSVWQKKCGRYDKPCHLLESDIYKNGSSSNILLFRGEPRLYENPGTSVIIRNKKFHSQLCGQHCTFNSFYNWMTSVLEPLFLVNSCDLDEVKLGVGAIYSLDEKKWITYYTSDENIELDYKTDGYYNSQRYKDFFKWCSTKHQINRYNAIKVLSTGHFLASIFSILETGVSIPAEEEHYVDSGEKWIRRYIPYEIYDKNSIPLDPMVSLSIDPTIAFRFIPKSDGNSETNEFGRFIILSVPKKFYPRQSNCKSWSRVPGELMDVNNCLTENATDDFSDEQEIDANFILPKNLMKSVILVREQ